MIACTFENGNKASLRHAVVDVLVLKEDKILLIKRSEKLIEGGKWALVGGYMEKDETLQQAVTRETFEETGYRIRDITLLTINDNPIRSGEDKQNVSFVYFCTALEKEGKMDWESTEQKWYAFDALPPKKQLAFDHHKNIHIYLKYKKESSNLPVANYSQSRYLK